MEIFEILDRYEMLYPNVSEFGDLRRAYIDRDWNSVFRITGQEELRKAILEKNLHSLFRLVDNTRIAGTFEDFQKAVLELNLHSVFRILVGNEDLRKAILEDNEYSMFRCIDRPDLKKLILDDNKWSLFKVLSSYVDTSLTDGLKRCHDEDIWFDKDCLSRGQIRSKRWLIDTIEDLGLDLGKVFLCAGWYGLLGTFLLESKIPIESVTSFDSDPNCKDIANMFNKRHILDDWKFKHCTLNINDIDYKDAIFNVERADGSFETIWETPTTIINTSCEHIDSFEGWYNKIPDGTLCILQCNDYFEIEEHVACANSIDEFSSRTPMKRVYFEGELDLNKYTRFMKIGYK